MVIQISLVVCLLCAMQSSNGLRLQECVSVPLGMESGAIKDDQLSASSSFDNNNVGASSSRIRTNKAAGAWCPEPQITANTHEWLGIDLRQIHIIRAVETQGRLGDGSGIEFTRQYVVEYWRPGTSKWMRYKDYKGEDVIAGNMDSKKAVKRQLNPPIIASKIRIIPYSIHPLTVCLRAELYGCNYTDGLVSYTIPQGISNPSSGFNFQDKTYDGTLSTEPSGPMLSRGLGQLYDGATGASTDSLNFESDEFTTPNDLKAAKLRPGYEWVGWKKRVSGDTIKLAFEFESARNFSAISFYTGRQPTMQVAPFSLARLWFLPTTESSPTEEPSIIYRYENNDGRDDLDLSNWIRIRLDPPQVGRTLEVELSFASEWIWFSEVNFDFVPLLYAVTPKLLNTMDPTMVSTPAAKLEQLETNGIVKKNERPTSADVVFDENSKFEEPKQSKEKDALRAEYLGVIITGIVIFFTISVLLVTLLIIRRRKYGKLNSSSPFAKPLKLVQAENQLIVNLKNGDISTKHGRVKGDGSDFFMSGPDDSTLLGFHNGCQVRTESCQGSIATDNPREGPGYHHVGGVPPPSFHTFDSFSFPPPPTDANASSDYAEPEALFGGACYDKVDCGTHSSGDSGKHSGNANSGGGSSNSLDIGLPSSQLIPGVRDCHCYPSHISDEAIDSSTVPLIPNTSSSGSTSSCSDHGTSPSLRGKPGRYHHQSCNTHNRRPTPRAPPRTAENSNTPSIDEQHHSRACTLGRRSGSLIRTSPRPYPYQAGAIPNGGTLPHNAPGRQFKQRLPPPTVLPPPPPSPLDTPLSPDRSRDLPRVGFFEGNSRVPGPATVSTNCHDIAELSNQIPSIMGRSQTVNGHLSSCDPNKTIINDYDNTISEHLPSERRVPNSHHPCHERPSRTSQHRHSTSDAHSNSNSCHYASSDVTVGQRKQEETKKRNSQRLSMQRLSTGSVPMCPCSTVAGPSSCDCHPAPHLPRRVIDVPRALLKFTENLGEGEFGEISLCDANNIPGISEITSVVAVKMLRKGATAEAKEDFHKEMTVLSRLEHENIVSLVGTCVQDEPWCMVLEYLDLGDLNQFLKTDGLCGTEPTSYGGLIFLASEIAAGMKYLEDLNYVHRDLATRNCLVGQGLRLKIGDFGMARSMYCSDYCALNGSSYALPIRWMAWESIMQEKFTPKSDVWSFGVTLWEILTFAEHQPFSDLSNEEVISMVKSRMDESQKQNFVHLSKPSNCPKEIYDLMLECWATDAAARPSFSEIHLFLQRKNHGYTPVI